MSCKVWWIPITRQGHLRATPTKQKAGALPEQRVATKQKKAKGQGRECSKRFEFYQKGAGKRGGRGGVSASTSRYVKGPSLVPTPCPPLTMLAPCAHLVPTPCPPRARPVPIPAHHAPTLSPHAAPILCSPFQD